MVRHAEARHVHVELRQGAGDVAVQLVIRDDGVGFNVPAAPARAMRGESLGLLGMRERVESAGGQLEIESAPGGGTEIRASFPLTLDQPLKQRRKSRGAR